MKIKFTPDEHASIIKRLRSYSPAVDPIELEFWWVEFWFSDTVGRFVWPKSIHCNVKNKAALLEDGTADSAILHELEHCADYRAKGLIRYSIGNLLKINEWSAYAKQNGSDAEWEMRNKLERIEKRNKDA